MAPRDLKWKRAGIAFVAAGLTVTSAWAGAVVSPSPSDAPKASTASAGSAAKRAPAAGTESKSSNSGAAKASAAAARTTLREGEVFAGAAKRSIEPKPGKTDVWERSPQKCATLSEAELQNIADDAPAEGDHLASAGSPWPENPNCIYMGGFGLGPMNPVSSWDTNFGLWVRAIALRDEAGDDLVLAVIDGEGWFWDYANKCTDCGIKQITQTLAAEKLGLKPENIVIAATHSHSSPDFIGGWGFVPDWYMKQVTETIKQTIRDAVASEQPAVLEYGEKTARPFNHERRDTYRSAEEQQLAWFRAYAPTKGKTKGETIATVGAYAAHPTTLGTNGGKASPDWVGMFEKELEDRFGGVGLHFMTGLGNMSAAGLEQFHKEDRHTGADDLAALISGIGRGRRVADPDIKSARTTWKQPVTNVPLTALGEPGFFDRKFSNEPATIQTGEEPDKFQCVSASPVSAEVAATVARVGEMAFSAAPGEIFSNFSNTMKEQSNAEVTFPFAQAGDALGYMPQSFEMSQVGQQGLGFTDASGYVLVNYEDSYAIDKCFGDATLENTIDLLGTLK